MSDIFVMLDLETLGNRINPVIAQIAAVPFTLEEGEVGDEFNEFIDTSSCVEIGLESDPDTIKWWGSQSVVARDAVFGKHLERLYIQDALLLFSNYIQKLRKRYDKVYLWGNGIRADNVWLLSAYKAAGMEDPINYNSDLDYRTLHYLSKKKSGINFKSSVEFEGIPHNALDDCKHQIKCAVKMWEAL